MIVIFVVVGVVIVFFRLREWLRVIAIIKDRAGV